jgi:hypothetical protein
MNEGRTATMIQRRALPDPMNLLPLACGISDETARIKASRLMNELMLFNDPESWFKGLRSLGFHENASGTKRWRAILRLPTVQKDLIGFWLDRKKRNMERPDAKRTSCVLLVKLFADELVRTTSFGQEHAEERGLYLGCLVLPRSAMIYPERAQSRQSHQESTIVFMKITFHSLQRLFQRGYGLSENGEVGYERLLKCLFDVWLAGENLFKQTREETRVIVSYAGLRFVLARQSCINNNEAPLDLITVLPPQK